MGLKRTVPRRSPYNTLPYVTPAGCRLVCWLQQPTGLAGLNGWLGWLKPDPDRSALNYGLLTRSTRPRWCQLTPDPKPLWWRVTGEGRQLCAMLAEGLKKKLLLLLLLSSWQCHRIPAEQGASDSAFCRTPFWVACHVLGWVWVCIDAGFVRLVLIGFCFCTACGVCGVFCWCPLLI